MSSNKGHKRGYNRYKSYKAKSSDKDQDKLQNVDETNPVIKSFRQYGQEIDDKHDRYERIFKLSRDITIESKRIIFLLHNADKEYKHDSVVKEANDRLNELINNHFKNIAKELENQDQYQYIRAYTNGLQEFIEAITFHQYIQTKNIEHWTNIEEQFKYSVPVESTSEKMEVADVPEVQPVAEVSELSEVLEVPEVPEEPKEVLEKRVVTMLPAVEYMLGLGDLTGELMRMCINNLSSGNIDNCFRTCKFVKNIYNGFLSIGNCSKEVNRKIYTLKQSLFKMEMVCYNITVRGSEVPKHMLANILTSRHTEMSTGEDEEDDF